MLRHKWIIISFIFCLSFLSIFFIKKDEEYPILLSAAMIKIAIFNKDIVTYSKDPFNNYLVKQGDYMPYIKMMENEGWDYFGKRGTQNSLIFKKGAVIKNVSYEPYTRFFSKIYSQDE